MKKLGLLIMVMAAVLLIVPVANAAIVYTDTTTKTGFDIDYSLSWDGPGGGGNYAALLTVNASGSTTSGLDWYASAFTFKFNGSDPADVDPIAAGGFKWSATDVDSNTDFQRDGFSRQDGFAGFYAPELSGLHVAGPTGALVNGTFAFNFILPAGGTLNDTDMPFKVGYWSNSTQGNTFGQLSANLAVPEPGTLLLLGSGLIGLVGFGRKKVKQ